VQQPDRAVSLRVPLDLAHALDTKLNSILSSRNPDDQPPPGRDGHRVRNMSDLMRECLWLGLKLNARDPELLADLKAELLADELRAVLGAAVKSPAVLATLKKIAASASAANDPDFG
jgi:hypothetical protein